MNVGELRDLLEGLDDDMEVRIMSQPSWPFEYSISDRAVLASELDDFTPEGLTRQVEHPEDIRDVVFTDRDGEAADVLYLVEGTQLAYGTKDAWQ